ncbi:MAG: hypothetical protein AAGC78_02270 [Cellvibrio sp.]|uniref:hypothetical protein n=1 Tax=Cellvibrio sp. TaxID=1965322 RepID=UPI0031A72821
MKNLYKQSGQGMASFIVATVFVLVPIFLGLNYLAKLGDLKHKTHEATRYAVWERTVWREGSSSNYVSKSTAEINNEIAVRVYGKSSLPINSVTDKSASLSKPELDANLYIWNEEVRTALLKTYSGGELAHLTIDDHKPAGGLSEKVNEAVDKIGLNEKGVYEVDLKHAIAIPRILKKELSDALGGGKDLEFNGKAAILAESWAAPNPEFVDDRVKKTLLTEALNTPTFEAFRATIGFFHPEVSRLEPGIVEEDRVPCQRLVGADGECD